MVSIKFWIEKLSISFLKLDVDASILELQEEEVEEIKFVDPEFAKTDIWKNPDEYTPGGPYWDEIMDKIPKRA